MANFTYETNNTNTSYEGLDGSDTLSFIDGILANRLGFLKDGDDLVISVIGLNNGRYTITLTNHFIANSPRIETLNFNDGHSIDLTASNIIYDDNSANTLYGDSSDNIFLASSSNPGDTIYAYDGNDTIYSGTGNDHIYMGNGDDTVYASVGTIVYNDGDGDDTVSGQGVNSYVEINYSLHDQAVNVDLSQGTADDDNDGIADDTLIRISHIRGSDFDDVLRGNGKINHIYGGGGDDIIYGDDTTNDGIDSLNRLHGDAGDDIIYGGDAADAIFGGTGTNLLYGEDGNDFFNVQEGNNTVDGGNGIDRVEFVTATVGVTANLTTGNIDVNNDGITDSTVTNIENLRGSNFSDTFKGNSAYNYIEGGKGEDIIYGSAGGDLLYGEQGSDTYIFENIADYANDQFNTVRFFRDHETLDISDIMEDTTAFDEVLLGGGLFGGLFGTPPITDYIRVTDDGEDTLLEIDVDGGGNSFNAVALLETYTGHGDSVQDMIDEGYLVIQ